MLDDCNLILQLKLIILPSLLVSNCSRYIVVQHAAATVNFATRPANRATYRERLEFPLRSSIIIRVEVTNVELLNLFVCLSSSKLFIIIIIIITLVHTHTYSSVAVGECNKQTSGWQ